MNNYRQLALLMTSVCISIYKKSAKYSMDKFDEARLVRGLVSLEAGPHQRLL
jgi:hypothetical protein